jgi:hypothetical protein
VEFRNRLGDVCRGKGGIQTVEPTLRGIGVKIGQADGGGSSGRGLLLLVARSHISFDYRLQARRRLVEYYMYI